MEICYQNNPKSLFRKYSPLLTSLTKHQIFRDYLGIRDKDIALLLPNGYAHVLERGKKEYLGQMKVFTRAIYAPKLYPALRVVNFFNKIRAFANFEEMQKALIYELEELKLFKNPFGYRYEDTKLRFLTYTTSPDPNPESTSVDGYAGWEGATDTWANARAAAGTTANDSGSDMFSATDRGAGDTGWVDLYRSFLLFDTSGWNAGWTFVAGSNTVIINVGAIKANGALANRLVTTTPASNTAIANADYGNTGTVAQATDITPTGTGNNTWTLNGTGEGNLAITPKLGNGITKFGVKLAADADNSQPATGASVVYGLELKTSDSATDPTLNIGYTVAAAGGYIFIQP